MELSAAANIAGRELRGGFRRFRILLACLAIGVASVAAVGSVRTSIEQGMTREGAALLGGDAEIEFTYRFADEAEVSWMQENSRSISEIVEFRSMAVVDGAQKHRPRAYASEGRRLSPIRCTAACSWSRISNLRRPSRLAATFRGPSMHPTLADRLGISVGDAFKLGTKDFRLAATLVSEPDSAIGGIGIGPRTIVLLADLDGTGLITPGSLFFFEIQIAAPGGDRLGQHAGRN